MSGGPCCDFLVVSGWHSGAGKSHSFQQQNVGNLKICTFPNSGIPVRRTRSRKSQTCTFRNSGSLVSRKKQPQKSQKIHFRVFGDSCAQNKTSEISNNALSGILGLLCAEQDVGNLNLNCTFRSSRTPVRRTRRRKSQKMHFQNF